MGQLFSVLAVTRQKTLAFAGFVFVMTGSIVVDTSVVLYCMAVIRYCRARTATAVQTHIKSGPFSQ